MSIKAERETEAAFESFDKWPTYTLAFGHVDARRITLAKVCEIAERHGITAGVVRYRRRYWCQLSHGW